MDTTALKAALDKFKFCEKASEDSIEESTQATYFTILLCVNWLAVKAIDYVLGMSTHMTYGSAVFCTGILAVYYFVKGVYYIRRSRKAQNKLAAMIDEVTR
jgi:histidinol dehydrogenase